MSVSLRTFSVKAATVLVLAPLATAANSPIDLGTLGGSISTARGINPNHMVVVGASNLAGDVNAHAFRQTNDGMLQDLGTLPLSAPGNSTAAAVSPVGNIAGTSDVGDPTTGMRHAFYFANGTMKDVGTLGGSISFGTGLQNNYIVGWSFIADDTATHAFFWKANHNQMTDLGTLPGGLNSQAFGVSEFGVVAGNSDSSDGTTHAVVWVSNKIHDLGTLGGSFAQANAINEFNVPVGYSFIAGDAEAHAWVGNLHDIGTLGGSFAQAQAINKLGVVVGFSNTTGDADVHAFVWSAAHGMVDLNSLLPAGSPWDLQSANGIASNGDVVGTGIINGESHAFLLALPAGQ